MENVNIDSTWAIAFQLMKKRKLILVIWILFGIGIILLLPKDFFFISIGAIFLSLPFIYYYAKAHKLFMRHFAEASGLSYREQGKVEDCHGELFWVGRDRQIDNVLSGSWNDFPVKIFNYSYTVGSGKSQHTYRFTILEIIFRKIEFPFIFLRSKSMERFSRVSLGKETDVPIHHDRFNLSTSDGYEIEALQIFSEQLLGHLGQNAPNFSIEFSGDRINIYDDKTIDNKKDLIQLLDVGKQIIDSSGPFISRLSDDFTALHPYYLNKTE